MTLDNDFNETGTTVTVRITAKANNFLIESARHSKRTKRCESELILEDHLRRFSSISAIGITKNRCE